MNRVFVLDPGLTKRSGHNYQMAAGLRTGFNAAGIDCTIFSHKDVTADLASELELVAPFSISHYEALSADPVSGLLEDFNAGAWTFSRDLSNVSGVKFTTEDMLVLPTAGPREIWGLALFLKVRNMRPKVAALFHRVEPPGVAIGPQTVGAAVCRFAVKGLAEVTGKERFLIGATNDYLAAKLAVPMGMKVATLPAPVWYPPARPVESSGADRPVVAFLGHMRANHGFELVPELVREIVSRNASVNCRVHLGAVGKRFDLSAYNALQLDGKAEVITGWLSEEAMADLFRSATVLVMPYARSAYQEMISAVFCNAVAHGKPCVVPSGTWMADQVTNGRAAGVVYSGDKVSDIAHAVVGVLANSEGFLGEAKRHSNTWREQQSGMALVQSLLDWGRRK